MLPKVSIVIPVYNGANYMREAMDSALNQTYENCEIIVVNDGSTDETEQIALSYGDRIRYFAKENGGVASALNVGIRNMTGEYFQYLPHDDILHKDKIERQIHAIMNTGNPHTICWSGWNLLDQTTKVSKKRDIPYRYSDMDLYTRGVFPLYFGFLNTVTVLIHRSYFEKFGLFNETLWTSQDYDMWFRTFRDQRTLYIAESLVDYRWHAEQGTQTDKVFIDNCVQLAERMLNELPEQTITNVFGNKYRYYYYLLDYYKAEGWEILYKLLKEKFIDLQEPPEIAVECKKLCSQLRKDKNKKLVLYCAGKNAVRLCEELYQRGIDIDYMCDSNEKKIGTEIQGKKCVRLDDVDYEDYIIVTKDDPEDVVRDLRGKGYKNVSTYKDIGSRMYYTMPYKDRVIRR